MKVHLFDSWSDAIIYLRRQNKPIVAQVPSESKDVFQLCPSTYLGMGWIEPVDHRKKGGEED